MEGSSQVASFCLREGEIVSNRWMVLTELGRGSFGAVYKVAMRGAGKDEYAMKTEALKEGDSLIKMEVAVLKTFRNQVKPQAHVCQYFDNGETNTVRYIVMELVGPNLGDLRRNTPNNRFTESTTVRVGVQCLEGIEALHRISFVHRDIKPANYAIGIGATSRMVYILDFGLARQYINRDGDLRDPRRKAGFRGTARYASMNAHMKKDLGRHDDLWSLLYILIEFQKGELPWARVPDKNEVLAMKRDLVADKLLEGMAPEYHRFLNELQGLQFMDTPNYAVFYQEMNAIAKRHKYKPTDPFDWENKPKPK